VLGAFAGVYLDRIPKKAAMISIDVARAVLLMMIPLLHASGLLSLMGLYVLVFVTALFSMAFGPALSAAVPLLVRENQLTQANAIMQSSVTIGQLFGPALSGVLIAVGGAPNALYVTVGMFVLSAGVKLPLKIPHRLPSGRHQSFFQDLNIGVRFVFVDNRMLLGLMLVASLFTLGVTGFVYLLPMIGKRLLHADAVALGWLWSALSIGILGTTVGLAWRENPSIRERLWMIAGASMVGGLAVFALTVSPMTVVAALFLAAIGGELGTRHTGGLGDATGNDAQRTAGPRIWCVQYGGHGIRNARHDGVWMGRRYLRPRHKPTWDWCRDACDGSDGWAVGLLVSGQPIDCETCCGD
jgi:MFS family permease